MKKMFEAPVVEIVKFQIEDIVTTSVDNPPVGPGGLPIGP